VQHDRHEEAREIISALKDLPVESPEVDATIVDIQTSLEEESKGGPFKVRELFTGGKIQNGRRVGLTIAIELMQQFTGANMM